MWLDIVLFWLHYYSVIVESVLKQEGQSCGTVLCGNCAGGLRKYGKCADGLECIHPVATDSRGMCRQKQRKISILFLRY